MEGEKFDLLLGRFTYDMWSGSWPKAPSSPMADRRGQPHLADEVVLISYPVLVGTGKRFFAEGTPAQALELTGTQTTPTGLLFNTYTVSGALKN